MYEVGSRMTLSIYFPDAVGMVTYEWYKDGSTLSSFDATYTVYALDYTDEGAYTCMITDESSKGAFLAGPAYVQVVEGLPVSGVLGLGLAGLVLAGAGAAAARKRRRT